MLQTETNYMYHGSDVKNRPITKVLMLQAVQLPRVLRYK